MLEVNWTFNSLNFKASHSNIDVDYRNEGSGIGFKRKTLSQMILFENN